jgi:chemotaxis protein CheZ
VNETAAGSFNPEQIIVDRLRAKAADLNGCLDKADIAGAFSVIEHINAAKEESIYYGLGMLARGLHTALVSFQVDDHGKHYLAQGENGAAPVTSQLDNVVKMSEDSTRKTLNILDSSMPLVKQLREHAQEIETASGLDAALAQQMREQTAGLAVLEGNLMQILMAQGFQDLSGQAIRKVNRIIEGLQKDLVALLTYANQVKSMSEPTAVDLPVIDGLTMAHAPAAADEAPKEAALAQDSVDDLLSSLGF